MQRTRTTECPAKMSPTSDRKVGCTGVRMQSAQIVPDGVSSQKDLPKILSSTMSDMASRHKQETNEPARFLFINEDFASVGSDNKDLSLEVAKRRHVQRRKPRAEQQPKFQTQRSSDSSLPAALESSRVIVPATEASVHKTWACKGTEATIHDLPHDPLAAESESHAVRTSRTASNLILVDQTMPLSPTLQRPRKKFALDPFDITTLSLHPLAPTLVQYYINVQVPGVYTINARAVGAARLRHQNAFELDMHSCVTDEPRAYAILTTSTAYMRRFHASLFFRLLKLHDKDRPPLYFKWKLIKYVQEHLSKAPADMRMFRTVYSLATSESFNGDLDQCKTHLRALVPIIDALGGLEALGPYFKERIIQVDLYAAALSLSPPFNTTDL